MTEQSDNEQSLLLSLYVTMQEAATILGVSNARVRAAVLDGSLSHVVMFEKKLIPRVVLDEYIARTRPTGQKPRGRPPKPKT